RRRSLRAAAAAVPASWQRQSGRLPKSLTNGSLLWCPIEGDARANPANQRGLLGSPSGSARVTLGRQTSWRCLQTLANESRPQKVPLETGSHDYVVETVCRELVSPTRIPC